MNYYQKVLGNLIMGDIAKSSDIHHIQTHIEDALRALLSDLHDGESYVLGSNNFYKNSFILTAAPKQSGRYIDTYNVFNEETDFININRYDVKQPILKTKTSLYSIRTKFRNTSNKDIPIECQLQDEDGNVLRSNTITLKKNTASGFYEIIFDLDFYPTPPNLDFESLIKRDGKDIPPRTEEGSFDEGYEEDHENEEYERSYFSAGVSKLYFVIKRANLNAIDLAESINDDVIFDPITSLGVYCKKGSNFPDKDIFLELNSGQDDSSFVIDNEYRNIYYEDIYANEMTYLCSGGKAIIHGERIDCLDTHISIEGGNGIGNVLTQIYLGNDGRLHSANKKASFTTNIDDFFEDEDDPMPIGYLPIALILTYSNAKYGTAKEPLIIQEGYNQLPRSHHERLRRLEKQMNWSNDIALPSRIKYTISDGDWIDEDGEDLGKIPHSKDTKNDGDNISDENRFITTDENGNLVVKLSDEVTQTLPVTLKEKLKDSDGKELELKDTDVLNISSFGTIEHIVHDSTKGTLILDTEKKEETDTKTSTSSTSAKKSSSSKETTKTTKNKTTTTNKNTKTTTTGKYDEVFDLWETYEKSTNKKTTDSSKKDKTEKIEREYKVVKGKNGAHDNVSSYPGMTFYTDTNYTFKKMTIPIFKFKDCSSVKFYIWRRQDTNNKTNQVPYFKKQQLMYTSKDFSLKKAKEKGKYQYMDDGFTIEFEKGGLSLKKGQYVLVAVPTPKSDTGSLFLETFKPKNSKNFCIKYKGAANASHFDYAEAYQEGWYHSALVTATTDDYYKEGTVISKTLTWADKSLERIKSVKPIIDNNLTLGNKTKDSYELYVNTGGDWIKVTPNEDNVINSGGATTFKWKLVFKGDGKSTPKLEYNSKKGYAIKFILTREKPGSFLDLTGHVDYNKNMCITSLPFDGDEILREYVGDPNLALTHSRFEGYEFARLWADKNLNKNLLIDIQGSDRNFDYQINGEDSGKVDLWSLHYCDLTLNDFEEIPVDYSDYKEDLEYDESNLRLKLDSEHSYNDDDIQIPALHDFLKIPNDIDSNTDTKEITFVNNESIEDNQIFLKRTFENPLDLTKYTGLKFKFSTKAKETSSVILNGLAIYISSAEERDVPSNTKNLPENLYSDDILEDVNAFPEIIDPDTSSAPFYDGKIIQIIQPINPDTNGDKIYKPGFYQYIEVFDEVKQKYVYKLQQIFDLRSYNIYEIGEIKYFDDDNSFEVRIEIDQDSNNMKHVKEIGIITLNDEDKYGVIENYTKTQISLSSERDNFITVTLKDESGNPLGGKTIEYDNGTKSAITNSVTGSIPEIDIRTLNEINFLFKGEVQEVVEDGKTIKKMLSGSSIEATYEEKGTFSTTAYTPTASTETADTTVTTVLTAECPSEKTIKVTLKDNSGNPLKDKNIKFGNLTQKTNTSGVATFSNITGNGKNVIISYNSEIIKGSDNKTTLYQSSGIKVSYDFRTTMERITEESLNVVSAKDITLTLDSVRAISEEALKIYDPEQHKAKFVTEKPNIITIKEYNDITLNSELYGNFSGGRDLSQIKETDNPTTQINIKYRESAIPEISTICYINNPFEGGLSKYKHLGIQLASDVYIPKDCLKVNICSDFNGKDPFVSVNIPTMNSIYYPNTSGEKINLSQIFKKIDIEEEQIKSISISITDNFQYTMEKLVKEEKPSINLFIGKIVLYRARTIPMYHNKMRFKFYCTNNGNIEHYGRKQTIDSIHIRKIGTVLDYD